jgi:alpha-L-fucosidase
VVRGLKNNVSRAYVVGNGTKLRMSVLMKQSWNEIPGLLYIDLPESVLDTDVTVVALVLDGPVRLHAGPCH